MTHTHTHGPTGALTNAQVRSLEMTYGAHNYDPLPIAAVRAKGVWVYDVEGNAYLDMMSAYSALAFGHCPKSLLKVLQKQAKELCVTSRAYSNVPLALFLKTLHEVSGFDTALPMNTGAEAVETAIKVARKWGYTVKGCAPEQARIIVCDQNFHGRTSTIVGFSSEEQYKNHFGPFVNTFDRVPFADAHAVERAITPNTCAVLLEPMQGEAGVIIPPPEYLQQVRSVCTKHNVLMICDEVQTGLARTGALFAFEHSGVRPDGLILGKALGGGVLPISAFCTRKEIMQVIRPGDHGSTFGGNPLASAVATQALLMLANPQLLESVRKKSAFFLQLLHQHLGAHPLVKDIRGKGLFCALELHTPAHPVVVDLLSLGVLSKDTHGTTVRLAPPLIISKKNLRFAVNALKSALDRAQSV